MLFTEKQLLEITGGEGKGLIVPPASFGAYEWR